MEASLILLVLSVSALSFAGFYGAKRQGEELIFSGSCKVPFWALFNALETMINVPQTGSAYPLSRYWLHMQSIDHRSGRICAYLEFVERVDGKSIWNGGKARAVVKKFGFVFVIEERLVNNRLLLDLSVYFKDLTGASKSQYQEIILQKLRSITRELLQRLEEAEQKMAAAHAAAALAGSAPLADLAENSVSAFSGPPPVQSGAGGSASVLPPPAAAAKGAAAAAANRATVSEGLRNRFGGRRGTNRIAFNSMLSASSLPSEEFSTRAIEWPSPQDYQEAIQNPSSCFVLAELKEGIAASDAIGMPKVASGAFASVYRLACKDAERAVRCFLHPVKDQKYRYEMLSACIRESEIAWTVAFEFMNEGMKVRGKTYPILMMDWVDGMPLNSYACLLCVRGDRDGLEELRSRFQEMMSGLRTLKMAHGDLQHGNILIRNKELVLVDYDGMFVPALRGQKSNEIGHPNYQHPARSAAHFDENIDNFSAWVIDTALLCLREDPSLISINYGGEESMLFHRQDFLFPFESAVFLRLSEHRSAEIRRRLDQFRELIQLPLEQVPPLPAVQIRPQYLPKPGKNQRAAEAAGQESAAYCDAGKQESCRAMQEFAGAEEAGLGSSKLPDWLDDLE